MNSPLPSPTLYVVSAPSGTGKTTLNRRLVRNHPEVEVSVSYTTRPMRQDEVDGVHYHFVSREQFLSQLAAGEMLEHAEVFGTLYGTSRAEIKRLHAASKIALLEIDVQGWRQAHLALPGAKSIFILPPSVEALWQRLEGRGTESEEARWRRLTAARSEIASGDLYDFFIVNHNLDDAYINLEDIVIKGKNSHCRPEEGRRMCAQLLAEFDHAPWLHKLSQSLADK